MSGTARLIAIGAIAVALGFGVGSTVRSGSDDRALPDYPAKMTSEQMHDALAEALLEPDTLQRALLVNALTERLDEDNVEGAEAAIDPIVTGVDDCDLQAYFQRRAVFDPEGAFRQLLRWSSVHKRSVAMHAVFFSWAARGGALEARTFVDAVESDVIRNALYTGLLQGWVRSDVDGVTRFLMTLPDDPNGTRNRVYLGYVTTSLLGFGGPDRLISWLDGIPDDAPNDFKRAAYQNMLLQFAYEDPERAARFHTERASHDYAGNALWMVAVAWQRQDPQAAFDWLLAQPEGPDRRMAMSRAMQRWYSRDARSAARWVVRADLGGDPDLRKLLYGITRQGGRLRQTESGA